MKTFTRFAIGVHRIRRAYKHLKHVYVQMLTVSSKGIEVRRSGRVREIRVRGPTNQARNKDTGYGDIPWPSARNFAPATSCRKYVRDFHKRVHDERKNVHAGPTQR